MIQPLPLTPNTPRVRGRGDGEPGLLRHAYLELHGACLGGVEGVEEVMGIRAGICKAEREGRWREQGPTEGLKSLKNNDKETGDAGWQEGEDGGVGNAAGVNRDQCGPPGV